MFLPLLGSQPALSSKGGCFIGVDLYLKNLTLLPKRSCYSVVVWLRSTAKSKVYEAGGGVAFVVFYWYD